MKKLLILMFVFIFSAVLFSLFTGCNITSSDAAQENYTEKNFTSAQTITAVEIEDFNLPISIGSSTDDQTQVQYFENAHFPYTVSVNDQGVLTIKKNSDKWWQNFFLTLSFKNIHVSVRLPQSFNGNITVTDRNGTVALTNINTNVVTVNTTNAQISVADSNVKGPAEFKTTNATVRTENLHAADRVSCNTTNAEVLISNTSCNSLIINSTNGGISVKQTVVKSSLKETTSNGSIENQQTTFQSMSCITSNANINSILAGRPGDYDIQAGTTNGNVQPSGIVGGSISIQAHTTNGNIRWSFADTASGT